MTHQPPENPVNPLPPVVSAVFLILLAIEAWFQLGARGLVGGPEAVGWRLDAVGRYGFFAPIFEAMRINATWPAEHLIRFVSYPFVHGSFTHMLFAGVMFLAMGKLVAETFGAAAMLAIFFASAALGALAFALLGGSDAPLVGAFPSVYGLIGAFTWLLWRRLSVVGANQARAFTLIGMLMGIQLLFGVFVEIGADWIADLAGFATGFALSFVLSPGGWSRLLARLRQD